MFLRTLVTTFILCIFAFSLLTHGEENAKVLSRQKRKLLFPQFTSISITLAFVSQISYIPRNRVAVNLGWSVGYGVPFNLSSFWSPMFWARSLLPNNSSSLLPVYFEKLSKSDDDFSLLSNEEEKPSNFDHDTTEITVDTEESEINSVTNFEKINISKRKKKITKRDVTAGEFYSVVKEIIALGGYHEDCLLKSVCELAKHPLADLTYDNLIYDVIHFILTPSLHKGFDAETEEEEQKLFERAEKLGKSGENCDFFYESCSKSPLHSFSNFIEIDISKQND